MSQKSSRLIQLVLALVLFASFCLLRRNQQLFGANLSQTTALTEREPNNQFGAATLIAASGTVEGNSQPVGDVDWYSLVVDQQGELQFTISNVAADLDLNLRVWNANKDAISNWFAPLAKGGNTTGFVDLPTPGRYFLEVTDGAGDASSTQPYTLQLSFTASEDKYEPNQAFGQATALPVGQMIAATILPQGDSDWYTVVVNQHGELQLAIRQVAPDLDIVVRVWNANRDTISNWMAPLAKGGDTSGLVDLPAAGRYYLEVVDGNSDARALQPYQLQVDFTPAIDANEPNNSFGTAVAVPFSQTIPINILPLGDVDWLSVDVDQHGELGFVVSAVPAELDINLRLWNANRDTISNWFAPLAAGGNTSGFVDLPASGRYVVEVTDGNANARAIQPLSVTLTFTPAVDPFEPNNSFGTASNLALDQSVQTNILPLGDTDWHTIDVTHQGELQLTASQVAPGLDIQMRLWNANKDTISNWLAPLAKGGDTTGFVDLPSAGRYYLEVVDGNGDARSIQPFTLGAKFIAAADQGEPNNTLETAAPVNLDTTIPANILPANDADWCRLALTSTGELHVLITNVAPELELAMRLWNEEKEPISAWQYPLAPGGNTEAVFPIDKAGIYYLEVVDNRVGRSIQPYLLYFSMQPIDPASVALTETLTTTTTIFTDTTAITVTRINVTYVITTITGVNGTTTSTQAITTTEVVTLTEASTRTLELTPASVITPTAPLTPTNELSATGNAIIRTSGQVGPLGGDLFVLDTETPAIDGARLTVLPGSLSELVTINMATNAAPPPTAPFGLFPAGLYWEFTPAGLPFTQPVTITLPLPPGASSEAPFFIAHWNGATWEELGGTVVNGRISAQTTHFSQFAVFCGQLADYRRVRLVNDTDNKTIVVRYLGGPAPDPAAPQADQRGLCPPPSLHEAASEWRFEDQNAYSLLLWPGHYQFAVSYPTPQPGVAISYFVALAPGASEETLHIGPSGLRADDPTTQLATGGSNGAPSVTCDATVPAGVAKSLLNPRLVVIGEGAPIKLEHFPPKGAGILFRVTASDPEGATLRQLWSQQQGGLPVVDDPIASGATVSPHHFQFRPTQAGVYDLFVTLYDDFALFAECRYQMIVAANSTPVIDLFSGRVHIEFGRLDDTRLTEQAFTVPNAPAPNPPATPPVPTLPNLLTLPSHVTPGASVNVTNTLFCPTALIGRFAPVAGSDPPGYAVSAPGSPTPYTQIGKAEEVVTTPAPVNVLAPAAGNDATNRWLFPGYTCVWAVIADADGDALQFRWELPEPIFGRGTIYAAVAVPPGYHADAPTGIALGELIRTDPQLNAYNALLTDLYNSFGLVPSVLWEAWDDPCLAPGGGTQNPCDPALSRGGVVNLVGYTSDGLTAERLGYTPVAIGPEGVASDCSSVFFISSLTPNPSDPGPGEGVAVTARLSPIIEGCPVNLTVVGTDGYNDQEAIPTNKDGEATLFIPGGAENVVDVVTASVCLPLSTLATPPPAEKACTTAEDKPGELIRMEVTYTF